MTKEIPQVSDGSDVFYWTKIFPNMYNKYNLIQYNGMYIEGDVKLVNNHVYCAICNKPTTGKPSIVGSLDVGHEIVYTCTTCKKAIYRCYTQKMEDDTDEETRTVCM